MTTLVNALRTLRRDDAGQDLIEYALLAGLIALVAVVAITDAGAAVNSIWGGVVSALGDVPAAAAP